MSPAWQGPYWRGLAQTRGLGSADNIYTLYILWSEYQQRSGFVLENRSRLAASRSLRICKSGPAISNPALSVRATKTQTDSTTKSDSDGRYYAHSGDNYSWPGAGRVKRSRIQPRRKDLLTAPTKSGYVKPAGFTGFTDTRRKDVVRDTQNFGNELGPWLNATQPQLAAPLKDLADRWATELDAARALPIKQLRTQEQFQP